MDPQRWRKIEALYHAALAVEPDRRAAFLQENCAGDESLESEVESLLAHGENAGRFLQPPEAVKPLEAGQRVSHYEIQEKLGEGGMGVVYKARDTRLGRSVALKFVKAQFSERFEREARAIAALNHPHIATLHDVGEHQGAPYLAMEFVEGRPLKGPRPVKEVIEYGIQIADALAAAHAAGIVHRDLKPANILVTEKGSVKILDFGLAKLRETGDGAHVTATLTGVSAGTPGYMSPEQIDGKKVDSRSDIFAFGCVLYELASGRHAFEGDSVSKVLAATATTQPKPLAGVPEKLDGLIRRCLRKDPERRFQHMDDLRVELQELKEETAPPPRGRTRRRLTGVATAVVLLAVIGWLAWRLRQTASPADLRAVALTSYPGFEEAPTLSPDGNKVAFSWNGDKEDNQDIYVKQIGAAGPPTRLTTSPSPETNPAWSPDDRWIAFTRQQAANNWAIILIPSLGGPERRLAKVFPPGTRSPLAWTPDSRWLVCSSAEAPTGPSAIWALNVDTSERRPLTTFPSSIPAGANLEAFDGDITPSISPDGGNLAFARSVASYVHEVFVLPLTPDLRPQGEPVRVTDRRYGEVVGIAWTPDGREIVYSAGGALSQSLWRVPVSERRAPQRLNYALPAAIQPAIARESARLVYTWRVSNMNLWRLDLRTGERRMLIGSTYDSRLPQYSPDGSKIAFQSNRSGNWEVWTCDADGANCQQLTRFGGPVCGSPSWSRDGRWLALDSRAEGQPEIYVVAADGVGLRRITDHPANDILPSWSKDGSVYFASDRNGRYEVWKTPRDGGQADQVTRLGGYRSWESPDGRDLYYSKAGRPGLFRMPAGGGEEAQVLPAAGYVAVTTEGVYVFGTGGRTIQLHDTATGKVSTVATLDRPGYQLTVSPDDAYAVWIQLDRHTHDLMLVEGFR